MAIKVISMICGVNMRVLIAKVVNTST